MIELVLVNECLGNELTPGRILVPTDYCFLVSVLFSLESNNPEVGTLGHILVTIKKRQLEAENMSKRIRRLPVTGPCFDSILMDQSPGVRAVSLERKTTD